MSCNFSDCEGGAINWASRVIYLLFSLHVGMSEAWYSQGVGDNINFLSLVRQRFRDINMQDVTSRLRDTTRGTLYLKINPTLCFMIYLDILESVVKLSVDFDCPVII